MFYHFRMLRKVKYVKVERADEISSQQADVLVLPWFVGGHALLNEVLGGLKEGKDIGLQLLVSGRQAYGYGTSGVQVVAEFLIHFGVIDVEMTVVASGYGFVGRVERCRPLLACEVYAEIFCT